VLFTKLGGAVNLAITSAEHRRKLALYFAIPSQFLSEYYQKEVINTAG